MRTLLILLISIVLMQSYSYANDKPFAEQEVIFYNDSTKLAGTLTIPKGEGDFPGIVLITGSGPENRDEEIFGFKIFKIIAEHLSSNGIAVLRYDDRGVGESKGNYSASTTVDFSGDALSAIVFMEQQDKIDNKLTGFLGHSEGGLIATLATNQTDIVDFIVYMASPGVSGDKIILEQIEFLSKQEGRTEHEVADALRVQNMLYDAVRQDSGFEAVEEEIKQLTLKELEKLSEEEKKYITDPDKYASYKAKISINQAKSEWFKYFVTYDPASDLKKIEFPTLLIFGGKDKQVSVNLNKEPFEQALSTDGVMNFKTVVFPDANHLFQKADTGMYDEYTKLPKEFVPGFLDTITDWIKNLK